MMLQIYSKKKQKKSMKNRNFFKKFVAPREGRSKENECWVLLPQLPIIFFYQLVKNRPTLVHKIDSFELKAS